ncbi:Pyruvate kinase 2 [Nitrospira japonica]|uniref:Pyruvate kinase n=1 Tax=Nitrospira japonica TaxID=1325564 RepID=A0A1W1I243_9BACT|nr:pyruvate kinase [Nitrospira japonica]SLM47078.1 Pyruvate kinase 2 [Nitrospira japonica]
MRKAKIVCTIGPASESLDVLSRLIEQGMDAARLNFSHGTHDSHRRAIRSIREAAASRQAAVAIIQDVQGPRIRVDEVGEKGLDVAPGQSVRLQTALARSGGQLAAASGAPAGGQIDIPVSYPHLARDVRPGGRILIDDGLIELTVTRIAGGAVECLVVTGGRITSHKGINLPGTNVSAPTLTDKDREDIRFGVAAGVDYVALSFVRGPEDIAAAKQLVAACGRDVPIIAKIERVEAVNALPAILDAADGVMIARGDLGVEMGAEAVPVLQKRIIVEANHRRRLVITATQMLESMTQRASPTRAEASDVANAVFDGTDAVMLSAETAIGRYPVETVRVMDRIVRAAEEGIAASASRRRDADGDARSCSEAICTAASTAASAITASAIVAFSELGSTARLISKQRPVAPIIAFTPFEPIRQRMALYWGVTPHCMHQIAQTDERVHEAERRLKAEGIVKPGERIVILSGTRIGQPGGTNLMKLHEVP